MIKIFEINAVKRFSLEGKIYLIKEDFGDMLLVSSEKNYFLYFPKLSLMTSCDKHCQRNIFSDGKSISCLGIRFKNVRMDSLNGTYVVPINGKNIYFHYDENKTGKPFLTKVTIPQFG